MKKIKRLLAEDVEFEIETIKFLFSFHQEAQVETQKMENLLRAVPNVTVVNPQETVRRGGRIFISVLIKVNAFFFGPLQVRTYVSEVLIPSIKKNMPPDYNPTILDWSIIDPRQKIDPYRWRSKI